MRHRIAFRLALSFLLLTLAFSLVLGALFVLMFRGSVIDNKKQEMLAQAQAVRHAQRTPDGRKGRGGSSAASGGAHCNCWTI